MDCSLPGSSGHGIIQTRIPKWVAIFYSRGSSWPRDQTHFSCVSWIRRQILYHRATWKVPKYMLNLSILKYVASKLEKAMATHSSTLAWKIPWMEESGRLQSMRSQRVGHDWATSLSLFTLRHWRRKWQPTPVFLPGESQGQGSLVGCCLWVCTQSDTTEATYQQQQHQNMNAYSSTVL